LAVSPALAADPATDFLGLLEAMPSANLRQGVQHIESQSTD
jgi:hypothetical protein